MNKKKLILILSIIIVFSNAVLCYAKAENEISK